MLISWRINSSSNKHITTYFWHTFDVTDASLFTSLSVELQRDDGAVVYLNGTEVFRSNMDNGSILFNSTASTVAGNTDETTFFNQAVDPSHLQNGSNVIAVEVHQFSGSSSDLSFDLRLRATLPPTQNHLFNFQRNLSADDLSYTLLLSTDLDVWTNNNDELTLWNSINNGDGTTTEQYLIEAPLDPLFIRVQVGTEE